MMLYNLIFCFYITTVDATILTIHHACIVLKVGWVAVNKWEPQSRWPTNRLMTRYVLCRTWWATYLSISIAAQICSAFVSIYKSMCGSRCMCVCFVRHIYVWGGREQWKHKKMAGRCDVYVGIERYLMKLLCISTIVSLPMIHYAIVCRWLW